MFHFIVQKKKILNWYDKIEKKSDLGRTEKEIYKLVRQNSEKTKVMSYRREKYLLGTTRLRKIHIAD